MFFPEKIKVSRLTFTDQLTFIFISLLFPELVHSFLTVQLLTDYYWQNSAFLKFVNKLKILQAIFEIFILF